MEDTLGRNAFDFVSAEHGQRARDDLRRTLELGQLRNIEYTLRKRDGSSFSGEVSASIVSDTQARAKGLIMVVRDVTERNRLQQQLLQSQKLESIGTLAGGIAHDFNNLLAVIMGNVSILQRRRALPAKTRESLADIMDAAERGSALTHQLLAYARGGLQKPAPTDLNRLIKSVLQMLRRTTPPQIEFVRNLSDELTPIIADAMQIEQVVMNLCLNAIQASQPPSTIEVVTADDVLDAERAAALELAPGAYVRLEVRDQGCGMDAETVDRMFEPFFTTKMTGRGMGLSATLGIVQSHYGQIRVASTPGGGTTMSVWLPTAVPQEGLLISPPEAPKRMTPPRGSETILVIDDDAAVTRTVDQILSSLGYCVVPHTDTDEAMGFLDTNAEDLDLVLINLHMPKCTGQGMLERIAKRWPELPALLASGFDDRELIDALLKRGAVGFVHKPFSVMTLATAVRKALDEKVGSGPRSVS